MEFSKKAINQSIFIKDVMIKIIGEDNLKKMYFSDLFSCHGVMARTISTYVKHVAVNDIEYSSYIISKVNLLANNQNVPSDDIFDVLNRLKPIRGFITKNYAEDRNFFTIDNAMKIDAIREAILTLKIDRFKYEYLLASFMMSVKIYSNISHSYISSLKKIKKKAKDKFILKKIFENSELLEKSNNHAFNLRAEDFANQFGGDVAYLNPPHTERQYSNYYHFYNTLINYYKDFTPVGKSGQPPVEIKFKSDFSRRPKASMALEQLIKRLDFGYIFLSYNEGGIIPIRTIKEILSSYGEYSVEKKEKRIYKPSRGMTKKKFIVKKEYDYLHVLKKKIL